MEQPIKDINLEQYLFGSMFLLSNRLQTLGDGYLQEITLKQWFLLVMIDNIGKENPSVSELAAFIGSSRQNVRKMLEVLEVRGYVNLTQNPQDKRNLSVSLTDLAYQFFNKFEARGNEFLEQLFSGIDHDLLLKTRQTFESLFENLERMESSYGKNSSNL